jgi:hypothetical protein
MHPPRSYTPSYPIPQCLPHADTSPQATICTSPPIPTPAPTPIANGTQNRAPNTHLTDTPQHHMIPSPSPIQETHHASHTTVPAQAITSISHTSPHTLSIATKQTHSDQHYPLAHNHTRTTWSSPLMVETFANKYHNNHQQNPENAIIRPPKSSHHQDTCIYIQTHPHTSHTQTYKQHNALHTHALIHRYYVNKTLCNKSQILEQQTTQSRNYCIRRSIHTLTNPIC